MTQVREPGERPGVGAVRDDDDLLDADPPERRPDADRVVLVRHQPVVGQPCPVLGEHSIEVFAVGDGLGLGKRRPVALVVARVFTLSAEGHGDLKIANTLSGENVPAPGKKGWAKGVVRLMLSNKLYIGIATFGRSKSIATGGNAYEREVWFTCTCGARIVRPITATPADQPSPAL